MTKRKDYDGEKIYCCRNCGSGFGDCACFSDRHAPHKNAEENILIALIDKRKEIEKAYNKILNDEKFKFGYHPRKGEPTIEIKYFIIEQYCKVRKIDKNEFLKGVIKKT